MRVSEDCKTLSILIPSGGDQTTGAIKVEGINGVGYSYSYINCKDNVFIAKFNSDNWDTHKEGKNISSNLSLDIGKSDDYPTNPDVYRAYPATGPTDYVADASSNGSGYYKFVTKNAWQHLLTNGALSATIMCADLAVQIDCYMSCTWAGGAIRFDLPMQRNLLLLLGIKTIQLYIKMLMLISLKGGKQLQFLCLN